MGSNPVGLDRGQIGVTHSVALRRVGGRLVIEAANERFRTLSDNAAEAGAVRQSFASSVLWGGEIVALDGDGRGPVDLTSFLVRDAHGISQALRTAGQGNYALDEARSALDSSQCFSFPENLEFEALLTYAGSEPGPEMRATPPAPGALSLVQHHSLIRLPDDGYRPRPFDPRSSSFTVSFPTTAPRSPASWPRSGSCGAVSGQEADRLLRRPRNTRTDPFRADRRGLVVGEGLRRRRLHRRLLGSSCFHPERTRSTCATTSSNGCNAQGAAGRTAAA